MEFRKDNMSEYCKNCYELQQQLDKLKAENDTLRQFLSKEPLALQALQSAYSSYKKSTDVFYEMVEQYKQTLVEIKEFLQSDYCTEIASCEFCAEAENCLNRKILQKISEHEVENKYNTKDIRHINENNQEYIAECNRMTK